MTLYSAAIAILVLVLYAGPTRDLAIEWWTNPAASHGVLIPPMAAAIVWLQRDRVRAVGIMPDHRGLVVIGAACGLYLVGKLGAEFFVLRVSFIVLLAGLVLLFWGAGRLRALMFPLVLLVTMIPLPAILFNIVASPLQLIASDVAARIAQECGVAVFRQGNVIRLAAMELGVAEACSGLHSLSALVIASLLLGFLDATAVFGRVMLAALALPVAVLVNVVRVAATAILADYHPQFAMGLYHTFSGWAMFLAGFAILWAAAKLVRRLCGGTEGDSRA